MSRQYFAIIARFPSKDHTQRASKELSEWIHSYCKQEGSEFDLDEIAYYYDVEEARDLEKFDMRKVEDDEVTVVFPSWGGAVSDIEDIFIKNGAIKVVEFGEYLHRNLIYMKGHKFEPPTRMADVIEEFVEDLKKGKVKGVPKPDEVRTKIRKEPT